MTLEDLSGEGRLKKHQTSKKEIQHLLQVVERDLKDSRVPALSLDRKFATAYSAILQAGRAILAARGYRTSGEGHHMTVFNALKSVLDKDRHATLDYFNDCRNKRNLADYGVAGIISEKEVKDLIVEAQKFSEFTHSWLTKNHPNLV
jgi:uncharacterized protein (UPF0332 family)